MATREEIEKAKVLALEYLIEFRDGDRTIPQMVRWYRSHHKEMVNYSSEAEGVFKSAMEELEGQKFVIRDMNGRIKPYNITIRGEAALKHDKINSGEWKDRINDKEKARSILLDEQKIREIIAKEGDNAARVISDLALIAIGKSSKIILCPH